jgi:hypothetical protein
MAEPGSAQRLELLVSDIEAAREDIVSRWVEVSELFHRDGGRLFRDPTGRARRYFQDPRSAVGPRARHRRLGGPVAATVRPALMRSRSQRHHGTCTTEVVL